MSNLVFIENNRVVTDSLTVSEAFNKEHRNVLKDIRELGCTADFRRLNFEQSSYVNKQNKEMPKYLITEKGFTLLVMGYTGEKAMEFKERYIEEFETMKLELNKPKTLSEKEQLIASMKLSLGTAEELETVKADVSELKEVVNERMTLDYAQQQAMLNAKNRRVEQLWNNGHINTELHDTKKKVHSKAWKDLKDAFGVASYRDIRQSDFDEAMAYIKAWRPRLI